MRRKQHEPEFDFGFYATVPRVIRTHYKKELSPCQKWLYVCLKDLCGDTGTCYRTLRVLSEETGISTGLLSESIPLLHRLGLVHAEKKRRTSGGKEVWHITIVDIWQKNGKEHPTTCCSQDEQTPKNVHRMNDDVHRMNEVEEVCSPGERECSLSETEERTYKQEHFSEERRGEERPIARQSVSFSAVSSRHDSPPQDISQQEKSVSSSSSSTPPIVIGPCPSEEAVKVMDLWDSITGHKQTRPDWVRIAAEDLARVGATGEQITLLYEHLRKNPPKRGINLETISKSWGMLDQLTTHHQQHQNGTASSSSSSPSPQQGRRQMDEQSRRNLEKLRARLAEKTGAQQVSPPPLVPAEPVGAAAGHAKKGLPHDHDHQQQQQQQRSVATSAPTP